METHRATRRRRGDAARRTGEGHGVRRRRCAGGSGYRPDGGHSTHPRTVEGIGRPRKLLRMLLAPGQQRPCRPPTAEVFGPRKKILPDIRVISEVAPPAFLVVDG